MSFDLSTAAIVASLLMAGVAVVYLAMALGARSGQLIWSGRYVGRLPTEQRVWGFVYGLLLILSGMVLLQATEAVGVEWISARWLESALVSVMVVLGVATLAGLARGSKWERWLFAPITLLGAGLAGWLAFT